MDGAAPRGRPIFSGRSPRPDLPQEILQGLSRLRRERLVEDSQTGDAVETEVAVIVPQLAPGDEGPDRAPVEEPERPDGARGGGAVLAGVVEPRLAVLQDRVAE